MSVLCPHRRRDWNRQHGKSNHGESGDRQNPVTDQSPEGAEMLSAQRKTPLQPEQNNKNPRQQQTSPLLKTGNLDIASSVKDDGRAEVYRQANGPTSK